MLIPQRIVIIIYCEGGGIIRRFFKVNMKSVSVALKKTAVRSGIVKRPYRSLILQHTCRIGQSAFALPFLSLL
jgi:hypothetical protein